MVAVVNLASTNLMDLSSPFSKPPVWKSGKTVYQLEYFELWRASQSHLFQLGDLHFLRRD